MKLATIYTLLLSAIGWKVPEFISPNQTILLMNTYSFYLDQIVYLWIMIMLFIPEFIMMFKPNFVRWLKKGIEDNDGELNTQDVKDMIIHYVSLWSLRVFVIFGLRMSFHKVEIPWQFFAISIVAAFGIEGLNIIGKIYTRK